MSSCSPTALVDLFYRYTQLAHLGRHNSRAYTEVVRKYKRECQLRRKIFNDLQDLRGNIRVFARVRPVLPGEDGDAAEVAVEFPTEGVIRMTNTKNHVKKWEFDHVFKPKTTNAQVFDECSVWVFASTWCSPPPVLTHVELCAFFLHRTC